MRWFVGWRMHLVHALIAFSIGAGTATYATNTWWKAKERDRLAEQVEEANRQIEREQTSDASTQRVSEAVAEATTRVEWRTRTLIREVPVYVTPETDRRYGDLPLGFVRLHDAAAAGTSPVPFGSGESSDTPSGIAPSTAVAAVVDNYGTCHVWREQVIGWQRWYAEQSALWAGERPEGATERRQPPPGP